MDFLRKITATIVLLLSIGVAMGQSYPLVTAGGGIQEWQTATSYVIDDIVWESEDFYKALNNHTSGNFNTDLANMEWVRMSDDLNFISGSTDGGIVRWDGVNGDAVQDSGIVIDDADNMFNVTSLTVGGASPSASSSLDVFSTTTGTRPWPSMSTAQRDAIVSPATGLSIFNTDTNKLNIFNGTIWKAAGSGLDAWEPAFDYVAGDVIYNSTSATNELYYANSDFTSAGAFNPSNWTEISQHVNIPGAVVDNTLTRWDGTAGSDVQDSLVTLDDLGSLGSINNLQLIGDVTYTSQLSITSDYSDANDIGSIALGGGGALDSTRGASLYINGNEANGGAELILGDALGSKLSIQDQTSTPILQVLETGEVNLPLLTPSQNLNIDASGNIVAGPTDVSSGSVTGVLPIVNGGTANTSFTDDRLLYFDGTSIASTSTLSFDTNIFEVSTPDGSIPMTKMNQASRLALTPVNGTTVYDTDDETPYFWDGIQWKKFGGSEVDTNTLAADSYDLLRLPFSQGTVVSSSPSKILRIETGNDNFLQNPSFEHETFTTGWTTSGSATFTLNPDGWEGQGVSISATGGSQNFELSQSYTDTDLEGVTQGFTCMVYSDSAKVKLCTEDSIVEKNCDYHDGNSTWKRLQAIIMPDSTGTIIGSVKNDPNEDAEVIVDNCQWDNNPLNIKSVTLRESYTVPSQANFWDSTGSTNDFDISLGSNFDNDLFIIEDSGGLTRIRAKRNITVTATSYCATCAGLTGITWSDSSGNTIGILRGASNLPRQSVTTIELDSGEFIYTTADNALVRDGGISITAISSADAVVPEIDLIQTIPIVDYSWENEFNGDIANNGSASITGQTGGLFIQSVQRLSLGTVRVTWTPGFFSQKPRVEAAMLVGANRDANVIDVTTTYADIETRAYGSGTLFDLDFTIGVSRSGTDYRKRGSTAAIIAQPTCFIKAVYPSGTNGDNGVSCTSGSYLTRALNTLEGQCDGISINSNVVTVPRGSWKIDGFAPAHDVDRHKAKWVRDPNGSPSDSVIGSPERATSTNGMSSKSHIKGEFEVTQVEEDFEVQHRCETTKATNGFGIASGFGDVEVYTQIGLTRIK